MTLGGFIDALTAVPPGSRVALACGRSPGHLQAAGRAHVAVALGYPGVRTAGDMLDEARNALGRRHMRYVGGTVTPTADSPLWLATWDADIGSRVIGAKLENDVLWIQTGYPEPVS